MCFIFLLRKLLCNDIIMTGGDFSMSIGERIKKTRKIRNLTLKEIAEYLGKTEATVQRYESGNININNEVLTELAEILSVSPAYLMGWSKDNRDVENVDYNYFDTAVSAGALTAIEAVTSKDVKTISLPSATMGKYASSKDIFVTKVNGESMNNIIPDESLIAVKYIESPFDLNNNDIVVFRYRDGLSIKRFFNDKENHRLIFRPDSKNASFTDVVIDYEELDGLQIYGKVVVYIVNL